MVWFRGPLGPRCRPEAGAPSRFRCVGGVPDELLFDQMRAVVVSDQRVGGGALVLNTEFLRFAAHWGFHPRACRPYRAQTKDRVENASGDAGQACSASNLRMLRSALLNSTPIRCTGPSPPRYLSA